MLECVRQERIRTLAQSGVYNECKLLQSAAKMGAIEGVILILVFVATCCDAFTATNMNLTVIPASSINSQVTEVDLRHNLLTRVEDNAFSAFQHLEIIHLSYNHISFVSDSAFNGTVLQELYLDNNKLSAGFRLACVGSTLTELWLDQNEIETLGREELNKVKHLQVFGMQLNSLTTIHVDAFVSCASSLKHLFLSGNHDLQRVPGEIFRNMSNLESIYLFYSYSLDAFPDFSYLPQENLVKVLGISHASFGDLPKTALYGLNKLEILYLDDVGLTVFPDLSQQSGSLQELSLREGQIRSIPEGIFDDLPLYSLNLAENELSEIADLTPLLPTLTSLILKNNSFGDVPCQTILDILSSAPKLSYIDFSETGLRSFPDIFQLTYTFTSVYIYNGQTMHCDCAMKWMIDLESRVRNTNIRGSSMPCASPARIANMQWSDVTMDDLCQDNNATSCTPDQSKLNNISQDSITPSTTVSVVTDISASSPSSPSSRTLSSDITTARSSQQSQHIGSVLIAALTIGVGKALCWMDIIS